MSQFLQQRSHKKEIHKHWYIVDTQIRSTSQQVSQCQIYLTNIYYLYIHTHMILLKHKRYTSSNNNNNNNNKHVWYITVHSAAGLRPFPFKPSQPESIWPKWCLPFFPPHSAITPCNELWEAVTSNPSVQFDRMENIKQNFSSSLYKDNSL